MNIIQRYAINFASKAMGKPLPSWMFNTPFGHPIPNSVDIVAAQAFERSVLVNMMTRKIMNTFGMAKPVVKKLDGGRYTEVKPDHPLQMLLNYPSYRGFSRYQMFSHHIGRTILEGNAFWYLKGSKNAPESVEILPSRYMVIVANPDNGQVEKYRYMPLSPGNATIGGEELHPDTIMHLPSFNPNNAYWGLSWLSAGMVEVNADDAMARWNQNFFGPRNAIPNMAVEIAGMMDEKQFQQMKQDWARRGGLQRETIFFRSGGGYNKVQIHNIGATPMELSFLESRKLNRKLLLDLFGIPEALLDKEATEASSITAERQYYEMVWGLLNMLAETLTLELATFFTKKQGDLIVGFEDIRPVNEELKIKQIESMRPYLEINEVRAKQWQLPPVEWGDKPVEGSGAAPDIPTGDSTNEDGPPKLSPAPQAGRQARGVVDREQRETEPSRGKMIALQKKALKAIKNGGINMADFDLPELAGLADAKTHEDVLRVFDPVFEEITQKGMSENVLRRANQMPKEHRELVLAGAETLSTDFGFMARADGLLDIDDETWESATVPEAVL
jgi:HK97 family phage portal protein